MIEYHKAAAIIQGHRIFIFRMFVVTLIQRLIHFSITYLVYRAMGLSALGFIDVVALQSVISISETATARFWMLTLAQIQESA